MCKSDVWKWAWMWIFHVIFANQKPCFVCVCVCVIKCTVLCSKPVQQVCGPLSIVSFCLSKARSNEAVRQQLSMHAQLRFLSTPSPSHNTRTQTHFSPYSLNKWVCEKNATQQTQYCRFSRIIWGYDHTSAFFILTRHFKMKTSVNIW